MKKPLFYLLIFSLLLNISSCKKVFDKDYYKDCVGEDKVSGDAQTIIPYNFKIDKIGGSERNWGYFSYNTGDCSYENSEVCNRVGVIKKDSMFAFKQSLLNVIDPKYKEIIAKIQYIDSSKQSVISLSYFYYPEPDYPYYFVSNSYHVILDTVNNQLNIFYLRKIPTKSKDKSQELLKSGAYIIIDKVINENTILKLSYVEQKCN